MGQILVLAGVNGAGKSSLLGTWLQSEGLTWFNPDSFTRALVEAGWAADEANSAAWHEGARRLRHAMADGSNFAFETTLGGTTIARLLREACDTHEVTIWFCGLDSVQLHIDRVAARVAAGGHDIPHDKIHARYDASRENLLALLPHLAELQVYDNSAPLDAHGHAEVMPLLQVDRRGLHYPISVAQLLLTPDWAKPIVMRAMELHASPS